MNPYKALEQAEKARLKMDSYCDKLKDYIHKHMVFDTENVRSVEDIEGHSIFYSQSDSTFVYAYNTDFHDLGCTAIIVDMLEEIETNGKICYSQLKSFSV